MSVFSFSCPGIENDEFSSNPYVDAFLSQFEDIDTDRKACFLFPESFVSQFFVIAEVCRQAEVFRPVNSLFPDEEKVHYLAVFDKENMDTVLLMYHLLYTNTPSLHEHIAGSFRRLFAL